MPLTLITRHHHQLAMTHTPLGDHLLGETRNLSTRPLQQRDL